MEPFNRQTTVAFTGYRPDKIFKDNFDFSLESDIRTELYFAIDELYGKGYRTFISGMAMGFDLWAADTVVIYREASSDPSIRLVAAIPFRGQERGYDPKSLLYYKDLTQRADHREVLSPIYFPGCNRDRNDWMLDHCSQVVCYFDGQKGGTKYTVCRAQEMGLPVINIRDRIAVK